jgi:segregation and condensation protein B
VPGKPSLYGTTREFLDYFNLKSLDQLPTLAEIKDLDSIHPELELDENAPENANEGKTDESDPDADFHQADDNSDNDNDAEASVGKMNVSLSEEDSVEETSEQDNAENEVIEKQAFNV